MEEDTKNNEFIYYNDEWNTKIKEDDKKYNDNI